MKKSLLILFLVYFSALAIYNLAFLSLNVAGGVPIRKMVAPIVSIPLCCIAVWIFAGLLEELLKKERHKIIDDHFNGGDKN